MQLRKLLFVLPVMTFAVAIACSDDSSSDGGSDATTESAVDLCDVTAFSGNGNACPHASTRICFPICEASDPGGCVCKQGANGGPVWVCTNGDCVNPCGNSSPLNDADCPDVNEASTPDASDDASDADDATDALDALDAPDDGG